jgi:hypothetical protein
MTNSSENEPWRELPARVAGVIEPELAAITEEILERIADGVPEYQRPLEGRFGEGIRRGVSEALRQFIALIRDPDAERGPSREVYRELGRGEQRQGRTLDSLQAAYRVGARVAWRRIAAAGSEARLEPEVLALLAESIFAYIDELAADSVEGYTEAQAAVEDERRRRRRALAALLMRQPPPADADLRAAAQAAGWKLPRRAAALACADGELAGLTGRLPPGSLAVVLDETGCVLLPDPEGPARRRALERGVGESPIALGPAGTLAQLGESWTLAKTALRAVETGVLPADGLVCVDDHLGALALFESSSLVERIAWRRLAAFETLTEKARRRMQETALAYIRHGGNAVAMARSLHVHPQTARYRTARLRELLGEQLDDPEARFELELALRASA